MALPLHPALHTRNSGQIRLRDPILVKKYGDFTYLAASWRTIAIVSFVFLHAS